DTLTGTIEGFGSSLGGLASLGLGLVNEDLGTGLANQIQNAVQFNRENQTDQLNAARRIQEARSELDRRDNTQQYEQDVETDGELIASLRRYGRDFVDTLDNATDDATTFGQGTAEATGSLLAAGPISRGITA